MIRYSLIIFLCTLLAFSSYLLYRDKYVVINIQSGSKSANPTMVQGGGNGDNIYANDKVEAPTPKATMKPDISNEIEEFTDDSEIEVHLDPTVGVDINPEQHIASSYKIIGPKQFVLLTKNDEPMVEIDLDTGKVNINPKYELDELSTEFWNSIGRKYPEVCFVEDK